MIDYDQELRRHNAAFRRALDIARTDHVLDIGCGAGESTRDAARVAVEGRVLGIDSSQQMIERANAVTGPANVEYRCSDAARCALTGQFDLAISRFGTMFFAEPIAAFANIRDALKPRGRLVMIVWQTRERNEWALEIQRAVATSSSAESSRAFSLGDPHSAQDILHAAGFADLAFDEVHEPVFYGHDTASALGFVSEFLTVREALAKLSAVERERARGRLRTLIAAHQTAEGVLFDSRAWIISARRAYDN